MDEYGQKSGTFIMTLVHICPYPSICVHVHYPSPDKRGIGTNKKLIPKNDTAILSPMKILIQRVSHAHVEVEGTIVGAIGPGALVFIGVTHSDTIAHAVWLANKLVNLRMFEDAHGKINQSLLDHQGKVLIVSQFTLYADCSEGRRPSFTQAAQPELAKQLYEKFVEEVRKGGVSVETGVFGAEMKVSLLNDGPVTLIIER